MSEKKRLVIYHANCLDGFTSAWAAWKKYGDEAEYLPASYGDLSPDVRGRWVLIVDFSYPRETMLDLQKSAAAISVFDPPPTAQAALEGLDFALFDMNRSGAGITWDALHHTDRPWLVSYVEDRDLWRFALPQSKEINAWVSACKRESFADWDALVATPIPRVIERGEAVLAYIDRYVSEMTEQARTITLAGRSVPMVNAPYICISELVGKLAESAPFAVGWSQRKDGLYAYSLRSRGSDGVDVSEIAKTYGGGGHRNAAGFVLSERLPEG
jgi:uncharacterized protein